MKTIYWIIIGAVILGIGIFLAIQYNKNIKHIALVKSGASEIPECNCWPFSGTIPISGMIPENDNQTRNYPSPVNGKCPSGYIYQQLHCITTPCPGACIPIADLLS